MEKLLQVMRSRKCSYTEYIELRLAVLADIGKGGDELVAKIFRGLGIPIPVDPRYN